MMNFLLRARTSWIGKVLAALVILLATAIFEEMFAWNRVLSTPLALLADWNAAGTLAGRLKFLLLLLSYASPVVVLSAAVTAAFSRRRETAEESNPSYQSTYDYDRMIAELVEAASDRGISNDLKTERVNKLFQALIDDVSTLYNVPTLEVRALLVTNDRAGRHKLTRWHWGRAATQTQLEMDLKAVGIFLETEKTYPTWEGARRQFVNGDSDTLLFIRNKGELKLGCLIAINATLDTEARIQEWAQIIYPFTMLGHMDKLVQFVVNSK
ncbi:hypothetical protein [Paenibacillus gansuensis]|uniref:Uncharacterized protein n=1 Tax=Paenibacillus gansuensis TaxID=306542 RepID=A0ABW5PB79_9BACL